MILVEKLRRARRSSIIVVEGRTSFRQFGGDAINTGEELRKPDALDPLARLIEAAPSIGEIAGGAETRLHQRFVTTHVGQEQDGTLVGEAVMSALEPDACLVGPTGECAQHGGVPASVGFQSAEVGLEHFQVKVMFE